MRKAREREKFFPPYYGEGRDGPGGGVGPELEEGLPGGDPQWSSSSSQNWSFRLPFVPRAIVRIPRDLWIMISRCD